MADPTSPVIHSPPSIFQKLSQIKAMNPKGVFVSLTRGGIQAVSGNYEKALMEVANLAKTLGFQQDFEEKLWTLIFRGLHRSVLQLLDEEHLLPIKGNPELEKISQELDEKLNNLEITPDEKLFTAPQETGFVREFVLFLESWFQKIPGLDEIRAKAHKASLSNY